MPSPVCPPLVDAVPRHRPLAGRYRLLSRIGEGGTGVVWRARDLDTGDEVAVKILGHHSDASLLRFVREQAVRIEHPHVAAPIGWAADGDAVLLVTKLVRGGSLSELLVDHGPLPDDLVATLLDQLLAALAVVHNAGLIHRDVKPANLLLEAGIGPPQLRLTDFGVAAEIDGLRFTQTPSAIGTVGFMAPEQALGGVPDPRQDLYAAGAVALFLLTGLHPARYPPGCPLGRPDVLPASTLRPLLAALLADDPSERPATAEHARAQLRSLELSSVTAYDVPDRLGLAPDSRRALAVRQAVLVSIAAVVTMISWSVIGVRLWG